MLRPKMLEWEEFLYYWFAKDPLGGASYKVRKRDGSAYKGVEVLPYTAGVESSKCTCQAHYDAAWIAGGEEVASSGTSGCSLGFVRESHDRKCEACGMGSATLYRLIVGSVESKICPLCKVSIRSGIETVDGAGDCY